MRSHNRRINISVNFNPGENRMDCAENAGYIPYI